MDGTSPTSGREPETRRRGRTRIRSWRAPADDIGGGADGYDRARMLPRLIALDPRDLARAGAALDAAVLSRLERALRAERRRGVSASWSYDPRRHLALRRALAEERLREPARSRKKTPPG